MTADDNSKSVQHVSAAQLAAVRRCVFDIEPVIGEVELCCAALYKFAGHVPEGWVRTGMLTVLEDLGAARISAKRIFTVLFENAVKRGTTSPDPVVELGADFNAANLANQCALEREDDAQSDAAYKCLRDIEQRIMATRATSAAGAVIKLRVAQRFATVDEDGDPSVGKMLASASEDLERLAGDTLPDSAPPCPAPPDVAVELAERYKRKADEWDAAGGRTDEENNAFVERECVRERRMIATVPTTTAGVIAYLDLVLREQREHGASCDFEVGLVQNIRAAVANGSVVKGGAS